MQCEEFTIKKHDGIQMHFTLEKQSEFIIFANKLSNLIWSVYDKNNVFVYWINRILHTLYWKTINI